MLPFAESFLAIVAALVVPTLVGLFIVAAVAKSVSSRYLAAFALGIYFWFFSDTIGGSSYLDVNSGFAGGAVQLTLLVLFVFGVLLLFSLDRTAFRPSHVATKVSLAIPLLVALAVGIHGFGEGAAFSATAATTLSTNLFDAFGGVTAAFAFILHKGIEPIMIGAAYWAYANDHVKNTRALVGDTLLLAFVFVLPGTIGAATDYFLNYELRYHQLLRSGHRNVDLRRNQAGKAPLLGFERVKLGVNQDSIADDFRIPEHILRRALSLLSAGKKGEA